MIAWFHNRLESLHPIFKGVGAKAAAEGFVLALLTQELYYLAAKAFGWPRISPGVDLFASLLLATLIYMLIRLWAEEI